MANHNKSVNRSKKKNQKSKARKKEKGLDFLHKCKVILTVDEPALKTELRLYATRKVGEMMRKDDVSLHPDFFVSCTYIIASTAYDEFDLKNKNSIPREAYASIKKQISIWNARFRAPRRSEASHVEQKLLDAAVPAVEEIELNALNAANFIRESAKLLKNIENSAKDTKGL